MSTIPEPPNIYIRPFVSDQVIELYWRPPVDNGGSPLSSYILECSNIGFIQILPPTENKIRITNLTNGLYYNFSLKATNINGNSNIAEFRTVQPGFPPPNPTGLDFTTKNFSDMPYINFSFDNPIFTGNINLTHNLVTLIPVDNSGNLLPNDYFKYFRSTYGFDNMREIKFDEINYNYNFKALVQSINDVNYSSYSNFIDTIVNPNLPTNGLKLWLDPFDLTTINRDANNLVIIWNDKSKNKYQATSFIQSAPTHDLVNACIRFNGEQFLNLSPNSIPTANSDYSILFYADSSNILVGLQYIFDSGNLLSNSDVSSYFEFNSFKHDCGNNLYIGNLSITSNITNLYEIYNDKGNISLFINGILSSIGRSNSRFNDITANIIIGSNKSFTGNLYGSIGEIVMYDRLLTPPERNTVRNYLQFKENELTLKNWGNLVVWLDANNPNNFYDSTISKKISYNSNVTTILDRSGANNNAIAYDTNNPIKRTVFNDFNIINFANSYIQISKAYYPLDSFIIVNLESNSQINGVMGIGTSANNYNSLSFGRLQNSRWSIDSTSFSATSISNELSSNLLLLEWNINNGNNFVNRNGTSLITSTNSYTLPTDANIYIGNYNGFDFANKLKGGIGEIISFNKQLTNSDRYVLEGYLSWKYGLVSTLANNHPYKDNPPYLFNKDLNIFNPKNPGNIILWFDASDSTNTIFSGNNLENIFDKSLRNNNPITYSNNRPTKSNINGLTSLYFNSNSGNVSYFSGNISTSSIGNVSVFIVATMSNATTIINPCLFELDNNNSVLENGMIVRDNSNLAILNNIDGNLKLSTNYDFDIPFIYSLIYNNSNITSFINGNLIGSYETLQINKEYNKWGIGGSGLNNSTFQNGWTGKIGEVITYNHAIDNNFRQSVEGYLAHKWSLNNYLPSNHTYKLSKPYLSSYSIINSRTTNIITIGTSTNSNNSQTYPNPYGVWYWGARHQFFFTQSELNASGIFSGDNITAIAFNCASAINFPMTNYTIGLTNTSSTNPISTDWVSTTQYWSNTSFNPIVGWNIHTFTSRFVYTGGGIVINTCFNNNSYINGHSTYQTTTLSGATFSRWLNLDANGVCTNTSVGSTSTTTRPNIRFYLA